MGAIAVPSPGEQSEILFLGTGALPTNQVYDAAWRAELRDKGRPFALDAKSVNDCYLFARFVEASFVVSFERGQSHCGYRRPCEIGTQTLPLL